jgi:hypothetical protein
MTLWEWSHDQLPIRLWAIEVSVTENVSASFFRLIAESFLRTHDTGVPLDSQRGCFWKRARQSA